MMKRFPRRAILVLLAMVGMFQTGQAASPLRVEEVQFFYHSDADARYIALREAFQAEHRGGIGLADSEPLALQAHQAASVEKPLETWLKQGGPHPYVLGAKAHLQNLSKTAFLNKKLRVVVKAKVGDLRVNPTLLITDYDYLSKTAHWETLLAYTTTIPVVSPGEEMLVPVLEFQLLRFLRFHPNQWPEFLQVEASWVGQTDKPAVETLRLVPDHFVVPDEIF